MFNVASNLLLVALALNAKNAFGTNQHLICKAVDDVFSDVTPGQAPMRRGALQGPPGKRGQTGVKGEPGFPGSNGEQGLPGLVDPQHIENLVEEKMGEVTKAYQGRIETLEEKFSELNSTVQNLFWCNGVEAFYYKSKCYSIILHTSQDISYANARELCTAKGRRPAAILNAEHQSMVADRVRKMTSSGRWLWLAMSYRTSNGTLRFSNGNNVSEDVATAIRWKSGNPISASTHEAVTIYVDSSTYGLTNVPPTYVYHGVLCEK